MNDNERLVELADDTGARAWIRPDLGAWLLRYSRVLPGIGEVDAIRYDQAVVDRYPREMWAGNPLLFPHVSFNVAGGKVGQYELDGTFYESPQHGFARRVPWRVTAVARGSVTCELTDNESTRPSYPFKFRHEVTYGLADGRLSLVQRVENLDTRPLPFSTGIHPYLNVPLGRGSRRDDCWVRLPRCNRYNPIGQCESFFTEPVAAQRWPVGRDVSGAVFLGDFSEPELTLVDPNLGAEVAVNFAEAPAYRYAALWSRNAEAPFYCLEPWTALPNSFGRSDGELSILPVGGTFNAHLWLEIRPMRSA